MQRTDDIRSTVPPRDSSIAASVGRSIGVPVVSLAGLAEAAPAQRRRIATEIDDACRSMGFFAVVDHAFSTVLRDDALDAGRAFFSLPQSVKDGLRVTCVPGVQRGYAGLGAEAQAAAVGERTPPDLSETYSIAPLRASEPADRWTAADVWPDAAMPSLRPVLSRYRMAADLLTRQLLRVCALALHDDVRAFDAMLVRPLGGTRINHYPAVEHPVASGQWRSGAHTDYGTLTLLATDGEAGLEIRVDDVWHQVAPPRDGFLVNVGDLLAAQSDGRWRSTWHRVAVPRAAGPRPSRTSIAFFQFPDASTPIADAAGVHADGARTAGEYLQVRVSRIMAGAAYEAAPPSQVGASDELGGLDGVQRPGEPVGERVEAGLGE